MANFPAFPDAYPLNIVLRKGSVWQEDFTVYLGDSSTPFIDLTGLTLRAKVKDSFTGSVILTFTCSIVDAANCIFRIRAAVADIAAIARPPGIPATQREWAAGVWDFELVDGASDPLRLIEGSVTVSDEATT